MPSLIIVAGMHRSGTSALTRCINLAGVPLPRKLMEPDGDNADGYWEPDDIWRLHDAILRTMNSAWADPREVAEAWFTSPASALPRAHLVTWLAEEMQGQGKDMLLVKEPRICRLLPLWQRAASELGITLHTVIPVRNPIEVARSLGTRNGFSEPHSFFLWLRHVLDAERFSRGTSRSFLSFDQLMADPVGTIRHIEKDLGLTFPTPESELRPLLDTTLKPGLRHHVVTDDAVSETAEQLPALLTTYNWVLDMAAGKIRDSAPLDEIVQLMRNSEQSHGMAITAPDADAAMPR